MFGLFPVQGFRPAAFQDVTLSIDPWFCILKFFSSFQWQSKSRRIFWGSLGGKTGVSNSHAPLISLFFFWVFHLTSPNHLSSTIHEPLMCIALIGWGWEERRISYCSLASIPCWQRPKDPNPISLLFLGPQWPRCGSSDWMVKTSEYTELSGAAKVSSLEIQTNAESSEECTELSPGNLWVMHTEWTRNLSATWETKEGGLNTKICFSLGNPPTQFQDHSSKSLILYQLWANKPPQPPWAYRFPFSQVAGHQAFWILKKFYLYQ